MARRWGLFRNGFDLIVKLKAIGNPLSTGSYHTRQPDNSTQADEILTSLALGKTLTRNWVLVLSKMILSSVWGIMWERWLN